MSKRPARSRVLSSIAAYSCGLCVACLVALALPARAHAYCRSSDEVGASGECVTTPSAPFLNWKRSCSAFSFNEDFFGDLELSEKLTRDSFREAFKTWAAVDCSGRKPFFVEQHSDTTTVAQSEYIRDKPAENESVILAIDAARWSELPDHSSRAIALTLMWHNKTTGEIVDWDMELNLGAGQFADCVAHSCELGTIDLQNTITHEAGHVLGLGHSGVPDSTMAAQTVGAVDTQKRSLAQDDEAGYCALHLPESACEGDDCSCADSASTAAKPQVTDLAIKRESNCQVLMPGVSADMSAWLQLWAALSITCVTRLARRRPS